LTFGLTALLGEVAIVPALRCGEVQQGVAQEPLGPGLLAPAVGFEPCDYIGIQPHGDWLFFRPMKFSDLRRAPVRNWRRVGKINVLIFFLRRLRACLVAGDL
jgi:hypothetical protein